MECPMLLLQATLLLCLAVLSQCQVKFVENTPKPTVEVRSDGPKIPDSCTASNGKPGVCYESRSTEFGECLFFPSDDSRDPDVEKHLLANICINTGTELFFCCPQKITLPTADECQVSLSNNIVGGELTVDGEFPWLAAVGYINSEGFTQNCGGTLITKQHVLTAAHCFNKRFDKEIVRLGEYDLNNDTDRALDFNIADERQMNFNMNSMENDIMILKLDKPVPAFNDNLRAACLPYHLRNNDFTGTNLTVVGWGVFHQIVHGNQVLKTRQSNVPLKVTVPVVPLEDCQATYKRVSTRRIFKIDDKQFCAGTGGGTDACNGDSGGPIHHLDLKTGQNYVVGLVSFGPKVCGRDAIPGVYTKLGAFMDWIKETVELLQ